MKLISSFFILPLLRPGFARAEFRTGEGGGGTSETSGNGNTLTLVASPTLFTASIGSASDNIITFNGSSQYAHAASSSSLNYSGNFSISMWFKTSGTTAIMISKYNSPSTTGYDTQITGTGTAEGECFDATHDDNPTSAAAFNNGNWHRLVMTKNSSGNIILYLDGSSVAAIASTTGDLTNTGLLNIACETVSGSQDSFFNGSLADVEYYSRAITSTEVTSLYNSGNGSR